MPARDDSFAHARPASRSKKTRVYRSVRAVVEALEVRKLLCVTSLVVNTTQDTPAVNPAVSDQDSHGNVSLRSAIENANVFSGADLITFDPSLAGKTINLGFDVNNGSDNTYGPSALVVTGDVTINGLDGSSGVTIARDTTAAPDRLRLFYVPSGATLTLHDLTLSGGLAAGGNSVGGGGGAGLGGAIVDAGTLNVIGCTFTNNKAIGGNSTADDAAPRAAAAGLAATRPRNRRRRDPMAAHPRISTAASEEAEKPCSSRTAGAGGFGGGGGESSAELLAARAASAAAQEASDPTGGGSTSGGFGGGADNKNCQGGGGAGMGGAIFSNGGTVNIINSTFTANSAIGGTGANNGQALGGAIFNRDGTLTITNSTLSADIANEGVH